MIIGISIPWYEMACSYGTPIDIIPKKCMVQTHLKRFKSVILGQLGHDEYDFCIYNFYITLGK